MQICDVCNGSEQVSTHPWGAKSDQMDRNTYPIGHFDLCSLCREILKTGGLRQLMLTPEAPS